MRKLRRVNAKATQDVNTGLTINTTMNAGRFYNRDGSANVHKNGLGWLERTSWFHTLLQMPRWKFLSMIFLVYLAINILFAIIYYAIGIEHLGGVNTGSWIENFGEAFFFSAQTFTTVGYGRINPVGFLASSVAALEALLGLLSLALATGLLYGRFSRPQAYLRFSKIAVVAPYKDITALMFRMVPFKNNHLTDAEVKVSMAMRQEENGVLKNKFFTLDLELSKVNALALSWTVVHPIDEKSPISGFNAQDLLDGSMELLVFVKAFDDTFSNTVVARTSYTAAELRFGQKFKTMFHPSEDGTHTVLEMDMLSDTEPAPLPMTIVSDLKATS
jgi:inward rectifier potassium channel